jgi:hypothetical protein
MILMTFSLPCSSKRGKEENSACGEIKEEQKANFLSAIDEAHANKYGSGMSLGRMSRGRER